MVPDRDPRVGQRGRIIVYHPMAMWGGHAGREVHQRLVLGFRQVPHCIIAVRIVNGDAERQEVLASVERLWRWPSDERLWWESSHE